jgi:hypothetical protein
LLSKNINLKIYRSIILPVVLYGRAIWSLTLRKQQRLLLNRARRKILGPNAEEVTGDWRRLHKEALYDLQSSPNVIRVTKSRRMRWAGNVTHMVERRGVHRVLVGRPEGSGPFGRSRSGWEDNIKMDIQVGWTPKQRIFNPLKTKRICFI